jgi:hypothetical protein
VAEAAAKEKVEVVSGLRPWVIAYAIVFPPIAFFFNNWMQSLGRWWLWPGLIPFPVLWFLLLFYAIPPLRNKITPQEFTLFTIVNFITGGYTYITYDILYFTTAPIATYNYALFIHGKCVDPYKEVFRRVIPCFVAPCDPAQLDAFYRGGRIDFGVWLPSMVFWMLWAIALFGGGVLWSFWLRSPLVEVERLPFPSMMRTVVIVNEFYRKSARGKPGLLDLSEPFAKSFWLGFLVGITSAIPLTLRAFLPIPWPWDIHQVMIDLRPFLSGVLPGAIFYGALYLTDLFVAQFMPLDVLATAVLWWFVWGVLYSTIGVRLGILPYTPGMIGTEYAWTVGPFKWMRFSWYMSIGLSLWCLYHYREHWLNILKTGLGISKGPRAEEGLPYSFVVIGGIAAYLAIVALMVAAGVYVPFALVIPLFYMFFMFGWTRQMSLVHEFMPSGPFYNIIVYDIGQALGGWGPRPDPRALLGMAFYYSFDMGGARCSSLAMHHFFNSYKLAWETKTPARDVVVVALLTIITTALSAYIIWPWWYALIGGYARSRAIEYHVWNLPGLWGLTYGTPPALTSAEEWSLMIAATVFTFVLLKLRTRYAWLFLNPVGMMAWPQSFWPIWLVGFLIKYITIKVAGARFHERYVIPFGTGYCAGYATLALISAYIGFFTLVVPEFLSRVAGAIIVHLITSL